MEDNTNTPPPPSALGVFLPRVCVAGLQYNLTYTSARKAFKSYCHMKENTKKTSSQKSATTNKVSRFASANQRLSNLSSNWTPVNEETLSPQDRALIKSVTVIKTGLTKDRQPILKADVHLKTGEHIQYPLHRVWEFERGDSLVVKSLTLCNLQDAEGNLKEDNNGDIVDYLYGDVE